MDHTFEALGCGKVLFIVADMVKVVLLKYRVVVERTTVDTYDEFVALRGSQKLGESSKELVVIAESTTRSCCTLAIQRHVVVNVDINLVCISGSSACFGK